MTTRTKYQINWKQYGACIRSTRHERGYHKATEMSKALMDNLGLKMGEQTIYKIEQGNQIPSVEMFLSLNRLLFDSPLPEKLLDQWLVNKE